MSENPQTPSTVEELGGAIADLIKAVNDPDAQLGIETNGYGKCVEAMWRAGYMAVELVARELGVTGFQHSVAALTLYGRSMHIEGPYTVFVLRDALYPQYDLPGRLQEFIDKNRGWMAEEARRNLASSGYASPAVVAHWKALASYNGSAS